MDVETLRAFFEERLAENQRRSDERYQHLLDSDNAERESMDKRFEAANRYKETYSEVLSRISNEAIKRVEFDSRLSSLQEKIEVLGRVNWPVYSSFAGIAVSMIIGMWVIIGLKIDATNQPVIVALEQTKIANESRDRTMADLRAEFNSHEALLANDSAERKSNEATLRAALVEVESQLCHEDNLRSLTHATDMRIVSMLWQASKMGTKFPTDNAFYAQVCNRNIKTDGK